MNYKIIEYHPRWYKQCLNLLKRTMTSSPTYHYLTNSKGNKHNKLTHAFLKLKLDLHLALQHKFILMTHKNKLVGIAILEGMYKKMPLVKLIGFIPMLIIKTGFRCAYRTINYFIHNLKQRNKVSDECHHLSLISIDKKKQKKGFGKLMMKKIHSMIEKNKKSKGITLETSNANVIGFYEKNKYQVYKKWNMGNMPVFHLIRKKLSNTR